MKNLTNLKKTILLSGMAVCFLTSGIALKAQVSAGFNRDTLIAAAMEIINANQFCALVTIDSSGQPQVRSMNPYPMKDDMVIWFATDRKTHKLKEIRNNQKVSVYWADHSSPKGYVAIAGIAEIIDDVDFLVSMRRQYWDDYGTDWKNNFVLIKIVPVKMNVVNYARKVYGSPETGTPYVEF